MSIFLWKRKKASVVHSCRAASFLIGQKKKAASVVQDVVLSVLFEGKVLYAGFVDLEQDL